MAEVEVESARDCQELSRGTQPLRCLMMIIGRPRVLDERL
jgi:hypothetical protein